MERRDGGEVAAVEGDDRVRFEALGERDHRYVGAVERQVGVLLDELRHPQEVLAAWRFDVELGDAAQERALRVRAEAFADEVARLDYHQSRHNQAQILAGERFQTDSMVAVIGIGDRIERPGVNDRQGVSQRARR